MAVQEVTDATFEAEVLRSELVVLVDFWAPWCAPCLMMAPVLAELADEHADSLRVVKLNVDENPVTAAAYRVTGLPTMNVYRQGTVVRSIRGARPKSALLRELDASSLAPRLGEERR